VPELQRAPVPTPSLVAEEVFPSYASTVDGQGERAIWIARNVPGRGVEVGQAVISDVLGLLELQVGVLGRKEYRTFGKEIGERGQAMGVAELDPGHARAIVTEARRRNDGSGRAAPEGADAWLSRIGPGTPAPDPAESLPPLPDEEERRALAASGGLHALPMLRGWLADEGALRALTLSGAEMLGLADRVGSLAPGKDADFVVLDGDPFSVHTHVLETWIEGKKVFDRTDPADRLYATGGFGAGSERKPYLCCADEAALAAGEAQ
jgi:hypothetical protein